MTEQERLNAEATERALRVGRQMRSITDALAGIKPVEPVKDDAAERVSAARED